MRLLNPPQGDLGDAGFTSPPFGRRIEVPEGWI